MKKSLFLTLSLLHSASYCQNFVSNYIDLGIPDTSTPGVVYTVPYSIDIDNDGTNDINLNLEGQMSPNYDVNDPVLRFAEANPLMNIRIDGLGGTQSDNYIRICRDDINTSNSCTTKNCDTDLTTPSNPWINVADQIDFSASINILNTYTLLMPITYTLSGVTKYCVIKLNYTRFGPDTGLPFAEPSYNLKLIGWYLHDGHMDVRRWLSDPLGDYEIKSCENTSYNISLTPNYQLPLCPNISLNALNVNYSPAVAGHSHAWENTGSFNFDAVIGDNILTTSWSLGQYAPAGGSFGCSMKDTISVSIAPNEPLTVNHPSSLLIGETGVCSIVTNHTNVIWYESSTVVGTGVSTTLSAGTYTVEGDDLNGCEYNEEFTIILDESNLGIEEINLEDLSYKVYNILGQRLDPDNLPSDQMIIKLYSNGMIEKFYNSKE